jgi:hypothetical protein
MSMAVIYTGGLHVWVNDKEVNHVTIAAGLTEIREYALYGCKGLTNLSFLKGSTVTTVGRGAFMRSSINSLLGMEHVRKVGDAAFAECKDLRTIEGLGCEEMGDFCFAECTLLKSMKGWPASMTVIPAYCFEDCTAMTTVDCDLSHVTSIVVGAFFGCTSLLPPSLSAPGADPAAVLAYLKRKYKDERIAARTAFLFCLKHAQRNYYNRTGDPCGASRRIIMEFAGLFPV